MWMWLAQLIAHNRCSINESSSLPLPLSPPPSFRFWTLSTIGSVPLSPLSFKRVMLVFPLGLSAQENWVGSLPLLLLAKAVAEAPGGLSHQGQSNRNDTCFPPLRQAMPEVSSQGWNLGSYSLHKVKWEVSFLVNG